MTAAGSPSHTHAAEPLREALARATYLAEHLHAMIDPQTWRDSGGDDGQGHYEGDYHAEQTLAEIRKLAALSVPAAREPKRITHGRHCICSACRREDWTRITSPCGMHGAGCPAVYAPLGAPGEYVPAPAESGEPWKGSPDPSAFGGHPYTPEEIALGYGTPDDPRFKSLGLTDGDIVARLRRWANARERRNPTGHGKFGTQLLRDAADALAASVPGGNGCPKCGCPTVRTAAGRVICGGYCSDDTIPASVPGGNDRDEAVARLRHATDALIEATYVGEPWQVSAAQREWDAALDALLARAAAVADEEAGNG